MKYLDEIEARTNAATAGPWEAIAHAREAVPALAAALRAVLEMHSEREHRPLDGMYIGGTVCGQCRRSYPCPTVTVVHQHLGEDD